MAQPRSSIFGTSNFGSSSIGYNTPYGYGYGHPYGASAVPLYGFWPYYWSTDDINPNTPSHDTRPGGNLTKFAVALPNNQSGTYVLYGDQYSVDAVSGPVMQATGAQSVAVPADTSQNQTVQQYRSDSFVLIRLNTSTTTDANATFASTLNQTIGNDLPIGAATRLPINFWLGGALTLAVSTALSV